MVRTTSLPKCQQTPSPPQILPSLLGRVLGKFSKSRPGGPWASATCIPFAWRQNISSSSSSPWRSPSWASLTIWFGVRSQSPPPSSSSRKKTRFSTSLEERRGRNSKESFVVLLSSFSILSMPSSGWRMGRRSCTSTSVLTRIPKWSSAFTLMLSR